MFWSEGCLPASALLPPVAVPGRLTEDIRKEAGLAHFPVGRLRLGGAVLHGGSQHVISTVRQGMVVLITCHGMHLIMWHPISSPFVYEGSLHGAGCPWYR
jgi:hypothetical protein